MIEWEVIGLLLTIRLICRIDGALLPTPPNARLKDFITMESCVHSSGQQSRPFADEAGPKGLVPSVSVRPMRGPRESELNWRSVVAVEECAELGGRLKEWDWIERFQG